MITLLHCDDCDSEKIHEITSHDGGYRAVCLDCGEPRFQPLPTQDLERLRHIETMR